MSVATPLEAFEGSSRIELGLAGDHQRSNAAVAVQLCRLWALRASRGCPTSAIQEQVSQRT